MLPLPCIEIVEEGRRSHNADLRARVLAAASAMVRPGQPIGVRETGEPAISTRTGTTWSSGDALGRRSASEQAKPSTLQLNPRLPAASQMASASALSFLPRLTNGLTYCGGIRRMLVTVCHQHACPMMQLHRGAAQAHTLHSATRTAKV